VPAPTTAPPDPAAPTSELAGAIARFIEYLRVERRLSPRTLVAYADDLGRLAAQLAQADVTD